MAENIGNLVLLVILGFVLAAIGLCLPRISNGIAIVLMLFVLWLLFGGP
jgi:hydrogenase/urease accessory protein HupE